MTLREKLEAWADEHYGDQPDARNVLALVWPFIERMKRHRHRCWLSPADGVRPLETADVIDRALKELEAKLEAK